MANIMLRYNAYTKECEFSDGQRTSDGFIESMNGRDLSEWCGELLEKLVDTYNENIALDFEGIERDCDTMEDALNALDEYRKGMISLRRHIMGREGGLVMGGGRPEDMIQGLRALYDELKSDSCPFEELRNNHDIDDAFTKALDTDFEIAVVATMSSGKSTLINAMLGNELLPARNEATTATIARIHDDDNADHFSAESFDRDGNFLERCDPLTLDNMNRINDNPDTSDIEIYGNIAGISSQSIKLVLTDTPGPNNSRDDSHKSHTYRLIQDSKYKPVVLYILNSTQLETNDDNTLLNDIAEAMSKGGRQASDRFIFVLNKADEFDTEKESVSRKLEDTKRYLIDRHGIKCPKVFPCSAYIAKLIRQDKAGYQFTKKEKINMKGNVALFIEEEKLHFSDMAPVSNNVRAMLNQQLDDAKAAQDGEAEALVYTGITAVEGAISEYLDKYAVPMKITEGVHSFLQTIRDLGMEAQETATMRDNQSKITETQNAIDKIKAQVAKGQKGKELKAKIDALSIDRELKEAYEGISGNKIGAFLSGARSKYHGDKITVQQTQENIKALQGELNELRNKFAIDIENLINDKVGSQAQKYTQEYNNYVSELLGSAFGHEVKAASVLGSLASMKLETNEMSSFEFNEREQTGTHMETETKTRTEKRQQTKTGTRKKSGFGGWWGRVWGAVFGQNDWGYEDYTYSVEVPVEVSYEVQKEVADYETRQYVNFDKMFKQMVVPRLDDFSAEARKITFQLAKQEEDKLKGAFKRSFDELDNKIRAKLDEEQQKLSDKDALDRAVKESEEKLQWLAEFNEHLNQLLS